MEQKVSHRSFWLKQIKYKINCQICFFSFEKKIITEIVKIIFKKKYSEKSGIYLMNKKHMVASNSYDEKNSYLLLYPKGD